MACRFASVLGAGQHRVGRDAAVAGFAGQGYDFQFVRPPWTRRTLEGPACARPVASEPMHTTCARAPASAAEAAHEKLIPSDR